MLNRAAEGATFLLNSPYGANEIWDVLPRLVQEQIMGKVLFGANSFIFYLVVYGIEIMFAIILTLVISKKIKK